MEFSIASRTKHNPEDRQIVLQDRRLKVKLGEIQDQGNELASITLFEGNEIKNNSLVIRYSQKIGKNTDLYGEIFLWNPRSKSWVSHARTHVWRFTQQ